MAAAGPQTPGCGAALSLVAWVTLAVAPVPKPCSAPSASPPPCALQQLTCCALVLRLPRAHLGTQVTLHGTETVSRPGGATAGRLGSRSHGAAGWAPLLPGRVGIVSRMVPLQDGSICCNLGKRSYLSNSLESLPLAY